MSPIGCFLILLVTVIKALQARAECSIPDYFLPYGLGVGDAEIAPAALHWNVLDLPAPYLIFGNSASGNEIAISYNGGVTVVDLPLYEQGMILQPNKISSAESHLRVGNIYNRYSTNSSDLNIVNSMACGPFDGVIVITYDCIGLPASSPKLSYQILIATGPTKTVVIFNYATSMIQEAHPSRYIADYATFTFGLDEADIGDDGITILDVTDAPKLNRGAVFPVETGGPCPATSKTCSVYADGRVQTLNGSTVFNELTLKKSLVATVDKEGKKKNDDPCKFFLMISTNGAYEPVNYVRIGVGLHPKNTWKYLSKFQFSLTNDSFVKEFGYSLSSGKFLHQPDMPYAMDDTGSAVPLEITVEVTDANDGWVIKSATCGYSFTHLWNNQDPIVTMTLDGERYDGRIQGTCGGM